MVDGVDDGVVNRSRLGQEGGQHRYDGCDGALVEEETLEHRRKIVDNLAVEDSVWKWYAGY